MATSRRLMNDGRSTMQPIRVIRMTHRRVREEGKTLPQSEWDYQQVFNNAQVGLFLTRATDGKIVESNERFAQMLGYDNRAQLLTEFVASEHYLEPGARERLLAILRQAGEVNAFDALFSRPDGSSVWLRLSARIYPAENLIQGVAIDITQQKQAEKALKETNRHLEEMLAKRQRVQRDQRDRLLGESPF